MNDSEVSEALSAVSSEFRLGMEIEIASSRGKAGVVDFVISLQVNLVYHKEFIEAA